MKKFRRCVIFLVMLIIVITVALWYTSYHLIKINPVTIESEKLSEPVRLAVMADLHDHCFGEAQEELLQAIDEVDVDAILLVGDMLNADSQSSEQLIDWLEALVLLKPVYYALGNHEYAYMDQQDLELLRLIEDTGAVIVEKSYQDVVIGGQSIRIGGLYDYAFALDDDNSTNPDRMEAETYQFLVDFQSVDAYKIMLSHRPDAFIFGEASKTWDIDLVVSGHLHGGQVVLPFLGGIYGGDQGYFPEYVHGLYTKDRLQLLVTSGLSSQKKRVPRWNNPPELMVLELR